MKIKNEKGEEVEVFTAAEADAKAKEASEAAAKKAIEDFQAANPDKGKEVEDLKNKLADSERKLQEAIDDEGGDGKSKGQIERLRKERDDAKLQAENAVKGVIAKIDEFRKEYMGDAKTEWLDRLSNKDTEMRKKIEFHFDNYRKDAVTKKDIEERMTVAYQLATGNKPTPGLLDGKTSAGDRGAGGGYTPPETKDLTPNQKAIGTVLGITDKDREDYKKFEAVMAQKKAAGLIPS
jgi:hypothetical protein